MNSLMMHKLFEESILFFCKDSKIKINIDNKYYNLEDFGKSIDLDKIFLTLKNAQVLVEDGVTIGNIVNALNVFADNITLLTGKDFESYHKLNNLITHHDGHLFDSICFSKTLIYTDNHKEKPVIKLRDNTPRSTFNVEYKLDAFGKNKGDDESYSTLVSISKIKNVPVKFLNETSIFLSAYTGDIEKSKENDKESKRQHIHKKVTKQNDILFFDFINTLFNYVFFYETASTLEDDEEYINEIEKRLDECYDIDNNKKDNVVPINNNVKVEKEENKETRAEVSKGFSSDISNMLKMMKENEKYRINVFREIIKKDNIIANISRLDIK